MIDKDFEKKWEIELVNSNDIPPIEMKYAGKKSIEYDVYYWDDFYLDIRKHYDGFYQVIYCDAYGDWNGMLKTKEEIKKQYNIDL